ncbi:MAG: methyltransferase domain-containing protein [Sulfurimonas sp.]|nr:methyltransferase domain-containing protein [Sulfurimonas sp.]
MDTEKEYLRNESFIAYWEKKHNDPNYRHEELSSIVQRYLLRLINEANGYLLDHGCGGGRASLEIAENEKKLALCDLSSVSIKKTLELLGRHHVSNMVLWSHVGPIETWIGQKGWGGVCSHRVLHAIPRSVRLITVKSLVSGLKKSGKVLLTAKSLNCRRFTLLKGDSEFEQIEGDGQTFLRKNPFRYIHYFAYDELCEILMNSGLRVLAYEEFDERTGNLERSEATAYNRYWLFYAEKIIS